VKGTKNQESGVRSQESGSIGRSPIFTPSSCHLVTLSSCHPVTLVIGYGNDRRGDDAAGPRVAAAVAEWGAPGVLALATHQLAPELAEMLAAAERVIFIDACAAPEQAEVETQLIGPADRDTALGHTCDPRMVLALAEALYGYRPLAWSITVPAQSFALGADLSPAAERGVAGALQQIRELIRISPGSHADTQAPGL
jgi:hydrogenase maturation protease